MGNSKFADELSIEEDAERKIGWLLKSIFVGTAAFVGYQFFPYMGMPNTVLVWPFVFIIDLTLFACFLFTGDNMLRQSVSLLHVKDPFFKRSGASRLARFAVDGNHLFQLLLWKSSCL